MPLTHIRRFGVPLVAAIAIAAGAAVPAIAAPSAPAGTGTYKTWAEAQRAAGFKLYKPTSTYKLRNVGHVIVSVCEVTGETSKHVVSSSYGNFNTHSFALSQDNASGLCGNGDEGTYLGSYRLHGLKAQLWGFCGLLGAPPCSSTKIELWLTWGHKADFFVASSYNESRTRLVHFAGTLKAA
jgi:hypothetical protein